MIHEDVPADEKPFQRRRRRLVGLFSLGLFVLSVGLELQQRGIDPAHLLNNIKRVLLAVIDPGVPLPSIDLAPNLLALGAVLRNMTPTVVGFLVILWFGDRFVQAVYGLPSRQEASGYLRNSLFGDIIGKGPFVAKLPTTLVLETVSGELIKPRPNVIISGAAVLGGKHKPEVKIGGPASLIVQNDSAVLLERAGKLTRVLGPGFYPLRRFERVRSIVDLRPSWDHFEVNGMSREGIRVNWTVDVHLQIDDVGDGYHEPTDEKPYGYSDEALFKAATADLVPEFEGTTHLDWRARVRGDAQGILHGIMARYSLRELIMSGDDSQSSPRQTIQRELTSALKKGAANHGAKILDVNLRNVELQDEVAQQWVEAWRARWASSQREVLAVGKAQRVEQIEKAKAEAKQEMISAIIDGFADLTRDGTKIRPEIVLLRFAETMRRMFSSPGLTFPQAVSTQMLDNMQRIRYLIESGSPGPPPGQPAQPPPSSTAPTQPHRRSPEEANRQGLDSIEH